MIFFPIMTFILLVTWIMKKKENNKKYFIFFSNYEISFMALSLIVILLEKVILT